MDIPNMQNAGSLVVLGSINADHILNLQSFPTPGETVTGNHYQVAFGGKGANQAVAAGRSGANIAFIACTGDDSIGESVRQQLATDNIDITPVSVIKGESTGVALIFVNGEGENVIGIHAGANAALSPALVEAQRERIANTSALLMQLESPLESVMAAAKIAHQNKTIVALNPAPARELPDELLALVDIITPNETEAEKLTGIRVENDEDAAKAAQVLHEKGIRTVLITLGSRGVWASVNGEGQRVPGFRVQAVDTIAAGDTFNGALITALLEERKRPEWNAEFDRDEKEEYDKVIEKELYPTEGQLKMGEVVRKVSEATGNDAVLVTDVGQNQMMGVRYFKYKQTRSVVTSGGLGTMGFGLPAAMGAKFGAPDRTVCFFTGDGGMQMTIQELGTIMQEKLNVKIIILNNNFLGMVRQWQELFFHERYSNTIMENPDFVAIAKAYGIAGRAVEKREELDDAIAEMLNHDGAYVLVANVETCGMVYPMVPAGGSVTNMIMGDEK